MNSRDFDIEVIQETNKTAGRIFPIILNVDHPKFFPILDQVRRRLSQISRVGKIYYT